VPPVGGVTEDEVVANVRAGAIRLPVEIAPGAPEPLQAVALKALEARPQDRYQSARDMALDLARFLDGRPVTARPSRYASVLTARIRPHLEQVEDWLRLKLIHPTRPAGSTRRTAPSSGETMTGSARAGCCRTRRSPCTSARSC